MDSLCGTAGLWNEEILARMVKSLSHHGDASSEIDFQKSGGVFSFAGQLPVSNENETIWVVCDGKVFDKNDHISRLRTIGHLLKSSCSAEVIAHLYEEHGCECPKRIDGEFAFALWDSKARRLILVRDRIGTKPLYYHIDGNRLLFASEMKALLSYENCTREIDFQALEQYLSFLYILAPCTIFKGIRELPAGHILVWEDGKVEVAPHWDLHYERKEYSEEDLCEEILRKLKESIKWRSEGDVPPGVFISGGIDSSAIAALLCKQFEEPIHTFAIGFGKAGKHFDELESARRASEFLGTIHHEYVVKADIVEELPKILWRFDEPFANPTNLLTHVLAKEAKEHVPVALAGVGGDEAFGGYPRFIGMRFMDFYSKLPSFFREGMISKIATLLPESASGKHIGRRLKRFLKTSNLNPLERYLSWLSRLDGEEKRALYQESFLAEIGDFSSSDLMRMYLLSDKATDIYDRMFYTDIKTNVPYCQLRYFDRTSRNTGLQIRFPFCDTQVMELSAIIPASLKLKNFQTKYILRKALKDFLPDDILTRKKVGFDAPVSLWLQNELRPLALRILSSENISKRCYFKYDAVKNMIQQHLEGRRDLGFQIWALLVLEVWLRLYVDEKINSEPSFRLGEMF